MNREIEIQVQVEKIKPLIDLLEKEGKFEFENRQIDEYFTPAHRNFAEKKPVAEWLRLRDSDGKYSITYKKWHYNANSSQNFADEHETSVSDFDQLRKIFIALDMRPVVKVSKIRKVYLYEDYEIALDKVEGLGDFVEVEWKGSREIDPEKVINQMKFFLKSLNLGKITKNDVGYAYMLLFTDEEITTTEL